jgi:hypothetical protein
LRRARRHRFNLFVGHAVLAQGGHDFVLDEQNELPNRSYSSRQRSGPQAAPGMATMPTTAEAERADDYTAAEAGYRALAASPDPAPSMAGQLALG